MYPHLPSRPPLAALAPLVVAFAVLSTSSVADAGSSPDGAAADASPSGAAVGVRGTW
jgi:hypothetical protein